LRAYAPSYVTNNIKINAALKKLTFDLPFTKKNFKILKFFKHIGLIRKFNLFLNSKNMKNFFKIYLFFFKNLTIYKNFKIISLPSRSFFISNSALSLLHKKSYNSIFIIETDKGLLTHLESLKMKKGGRVLGFISF
jgi:ribosomal protein S8